MEHEERSFDHEVDVLVVGAGAGGMVSAWTAAAAGLDALVIEKAELYGGNSALSGGGAWMPNAPEFIRQGQRDDPEKLFAYLRAIAPDVDPRAPTALPLGGPQARRGARGDSVLPQRLLLGQGVLGLSPREGRQSTRAWAVGGADRPTPARRRRPRLRGGTARIPGAPRGNVDDQRRLPRPDYLRWSGWRGKRALLRLARPNRRGAASRPGDDDQRRRAGHPSAFGAPSQAGVPLWLETPMQIVDHRLAADALWGCMSSADGRPADRRAPRRHARHRRL